MGAGNAIAAAGAVPGKISERARVVLLVMSLHALDKDYPKRRARLYTGGRELLCHTLRWFPSTASFRKIDRAYAELIGAGLIEKLTHAGPGRPTVYRLILPVDNPVDTGRLRGPKTD